MAAGLRLRLKPSTLWIAAGFVIAAVVDAVLRYHGHPGPRAIAFVAVFVGGAPLLAARLVRGRNALVRRLRQQAIDIGAERRAQVRAALTRERLRMAAHFRETLLIGMQALADRAVTAEAAATDREQEILEIETAARDLLSRTREEVVSLTSSRPEPPHLGAELNRSAPIRPMSRALRDAVRPWTILAGGALCAGLSVETKTLAIDVPPPLACLACLAVALPLALAWTRPLRMTAALWALAVLFDAFVAPLDTSFTAIGLSFAPPFVVAALEPRRHAVTGLVICVLGEAACFGEAGLVANTAVVVCCFVAGVVFNERSRLVEQLHANNLLLAEEQAAAAGKAVGEERLRIARELHDAVGHTLTVVVLQAGAARRICHTDPARTDAALGTISAVARDGLAELRRGAVLADVSIAPAPDGRSVEDLLAGARAAGLEISARLDEVEARLAAGSRLAAYRVVQESLTNILRHAPGASAEVTLHGLGEHVEIVVANSAVEAPPDEGLGARHGLHGMRQRVEACGGRITWGPRPGGGFEVRVRLPVQLATS